MAVTNVNQFTYLSRKKKSTYKVFPLSSSQRVFFLCFGFFPICLERELWFVSAFLSHTLEFDVSSCPQWRHRLKKKNRVDVFIGIIINTTNVTILNLSLSVLPVSPSQSFAQSRHCLHNYYKKNCHHSYRVYHYVFLSSSFFIILSLILMVVTHMADFNCYYYFFGARYASTR